MCRIRRQHNLIIKPHEVYGKLIVPCLKLRLKIQLLHKAGPQDDQQKYHQFHFATPSFPYLWRCLMNASYLFITYLTLPSVLLFHMVYD